MQGATFMYTTGCYSAKRNDDMGSLNEYIESKNANGEYLKVKPLYAVIISDALWAEKMLNKYILKHTEEDSEGKTYRLTYGKFCKNFGVNLNGEMEYDIECYCPIAFLVSCDILKMDQILPMKKELLGEEIVSELVLNNTEEQVLKYIYTFYGSSENYLDGKRKRINKRECMCVGYLINILDKKYMYNENHIIDIEISFISQLMESLKYVIYPDKLEDNKAFSKLKENGTVDCIQYKIEAGRAPVSYNEVIEKKIWGIIKKNAML